MNFSFKSRTCVFSTTEKDSFSFIIQFWVLERRESELLNSHIFAQAALDTHLWHFLIHSLSCCFHKCVKNFSWCFFLSYWVRTPLSDLSALLEYVFFSVFVSLSTSNWEECRKTDLQIDKSLLIILIRFPSPLHPNKKTFPLKPFFYFFILCSLFFISGGWWRMTTYYWEESLMTTRGHICVQTSNLVFP